MGNKYLNKVLNILIYFLVIILICLISYNLFLIINKTYYSTEQPRNSIKVGPIFIE